MNPKRKYILIGLALILISAAVVWHQSGSSMTGTMKQIILQAAAKSINGSLSIGDVDFSWSGSLTAQNAILKNSTGKLVASTQSVSIEFSWSDVLSRSIDVSKIKKIKLDGLVLHLARDKDSKWNVSSLIRKDAPTPSASIPPSSEAVFHGLVVLSKAQLIVSTTESRYDFKQVNGTLDFAKYPDIALDLESKENNSRLLAKGGWNLDKGGNIAITAEGVNPASFSDVSALTGTLSTSFTLAGTTKKPLAKGAFKVPSGTLGALTFSDATGEFTFSEGTLTLANAKANALGGTIHTAGPVDLDTLNYSQSLSGQNIDSSQLSEKDIHGRLQFSANVNGQGSWDGSNADGAFNMGPGSISGLSFDALSGNFSKRGANTRYYNIKATIAGQTIFIGDADSLSSLKMLFKNPVIPGISVPNVAPQTPQLPRLPKAPALPKLF